MSPVVIAARYHFFAHFISKAASSVSGIWPNAILENWMLKVILASKIRHGNL